MFYVLEFIGLLAVAGCLAASPILIRFLERFFPRLDDKTYGETSYGLGETMASDRSDMRDEIRRVTNILEGTKLNMGHISKSPGIDT